MGSVKSLAHASVELTAVVSGAAVASGRLAGLAAGETIEVTPDALTGAVVTLEAGGRTIARARLRQAEDRLIATIIEVGECLERPLDEWRFVKKDAAGGAG